MKKYIYAALDGVRPEAAPIRKVTRPVRERAVANG